MTQDQNAQTTNANDTIISPMSEQDLQDITGGCLSCGIVTVASGLGAIHEGYKGVRDVVTTQDPQAVDKYGPKHRAFAMIASDSFTNFHKAINTGQATWKPCRACKVNTALALVTKLAPTSGK
jgi:hypothetical protein